MNTAELLGGLPIVEARGWICGAEMYEIRTGKSVRRLSTGGVYSVDCTNAFTSTWAVEAAIAAGTMAIHTMARMGSRQRGVIAVPKLDDCALFLRDMAEAVTSWHQIDGWHPAGLASLEFFEGPSPAELGREIQKGGVCYVGLVNRHIDDMDALIRWHGKLSRDERYGSPCVALFNDGEVVE